MTIFKVLYILLIWDLYQLFALRTFAFFAGILHGHFDAFAALACKGEPARHRRLLSQQLTANCKTADDPAEHRPSRVLSLTKSPKKALIKI
jgi:hypothetical protein